MPSISATTIDVSNFCWSLVMPQKFWNKFRMLGSFYTTLPVGWLIAPVIAHETLGHFLTQFFSDGTLAHFHYLDDII